MLIHLTGSSTMELPVNDNSYRYRAIKQIDSLTLYYSLPHHVEIPVGAWCEFEGEVYTLAEPENFKKHSTRNFEYTLTLSAPRLDRYRFKDTVSRRLKFSLTAKPHEHVQMLVDNLNQREPGWSVGSCVDSVEKVISYNHASCSDALNQMAETFETEWEVTGKTVHLRKVEYNRDNPLRLSYGRGNGFKTGVGRSNGKSGPIEVLFVQGGSRNIDPSRYGSSELLLPKGQTLGYDGQHFSDEPGYISLLGRLYATDVDGFSLRRLDTTPTLNSESSLDLSHIYPSRVGTVTEVRVVDADKHFYDIVDSTIPEDLNFADCLIEGETMTIVFRDGMLAGDSKEFEVKYIHADRRFEIVPQEIDGRTMPDSVFAPQPGGKYAVFKMMLPQAYICDDASRSGASWDMFREAVKYLYDNEGQKFTFTGELDGIWAKKDWLNIGGRIRPGGYVMFSDNQFQPGGVLIRIVGVKDYINNPHSPQVELSNETVGSSISSDLHSIKANEVVAENLHREALQFAKRRFRDSQETISMLEAALLGNFTNSVSPLSVQTMAMLVGDESLQFRFVNSTTNPIEVPHSVDFDAEAKTLTVQGGTLQHLTLGIRSISSGHASGEYRFWTIPPFVTPPLTDGGKKYYLYARVSREGDTGAFRISETAVPMEGVADFWHLLVGVLNSEYGGERSYVPLYGYTEVLPGRITTDRVVSSNGQSYFDFLNNAFRVGSSSRSVEWNVNGDGQLRLRGTLVQSPSGDENAVGVFRGDYSGLALYYRGDEVTYYGSTYRCVQDCPTAGIMPINTTYWQVVAQKGATGATGPAGEMSPAVGRMLHRDPEFREGLNGLLVYNNLINGNTVLERVPRVADSPSSSPYCIRISNRGEAWPGLGGFTWETMSRANARFIVRFIAKIPVGYTLEFHSNYIGDGYSYRWLTGTSGTGRFEEYVHVAQCGASGTFWNTNYFALNGPAGTPGSPVVWHLAYATVFDATQAEVDYLGEIDRAIDIQPAYVYRGFYSPGTAYVGSNQRVDVVRHGGVYYRARRTVGGTFSNQVPGGSSGYWDDFGAQFESIATNTLLADGAGIGNWFIQGGKIVSTLNNDNKITLDANGSKIKVQSSSCGGPYSSDIGMGANITIDAQHGFIEAKGVRETDRVAYLSPNGILANYSGTQCVSIATGTTARAAVTALGYGSVHSNYVGSSNFVAGVFGRAENTGNAPAYGGYFLNLFVSGLILKVRGVYEDSDTVYLSENDSLVIGYSRKLHDVYLPSDAIVGRTIFFKQWWSGAMRVRAVGGQYLYDDTSENPYCDIGEGWGAILHFTKASIGSSGNRQLWLVSKYRF